MKYYKTVLEEGTFSQEIERSRFTGHVRPVETKEEGEAFISEIKMRYKDATHNVPALVIGDGFQVQWASDDGEPQGTSGAPIVQMLVKEEITNIAVVVTRYFGGIKLGTGGLVRAYTSTAKSTVESAGVCSVRPAEEMIYKLEYGYLNKLQNMAQKGFFKINDIIYEDLITVKVISGSEKIENTEALLSDLTSGTARLLSHKTVSEKIKI